MFNDEDDDVDDDDDVGGSSSSIRAQNVQFRWNYLDL